MDWAATEWKMGLPPPVLQKIDALERQCEQQQKEKQQGLLKEEHLKQMISNHERKEEEQRAENCWLQRETQKLTDQLRDMETKCQRFQSELQSRDARIDLLEGQISHMKNSSNSTEQIQKTCSELESANKSFKQQIESLEKQLEQIRVELKSKDQAISDRDSEIVELKESLDAKSKASKQISPEQIEQLEQIEKELEQVRNELKDSIRSYQESENENSKLRETLEQQMKLNSELQEVHGSCENYKNCIDEQVECLKADLENKNSKIMEQEVQMVHLKEALEKQMEVQSQLQVKLEELNSELEQKSSVVLEKEIQISDLKEELQKQTQSNKEQCDAFEVEKAALQENMKILKKELDLIHTDYEAEHLITTEYEAEILKLKDDLIKQMEAFCGYQAKEEQLNAEVESRNSLILEHEVKISELQNELQKLTECNEELKSKMVECEGEKLCILRQVESLHSDLEQLKSECEKKTTFIANYEMEVSNLKETLEVQTQSYRELNDSFETERMALQERIEHLKAELEQTTAENEAKLCAIVKYEAELLNLKENLEKQMQISNELEAQKAEIENEMKYNANRIECLETELQQAKLQLADKDSFETERETLLSQLEETLKTKSEENEFLKQEIEIVKIEMEQLKTAIELAKNDIAEKEAKILNLEDALKNQLEINHEFGSKQTAFEEMKNLIEQLQMESQTLQVELQNQNDDVSRKEEQLLHLEEAVKGKTEALEDAQSKCQDFEETKNMLEMEVNQLKADLEEKCAVLEQRETEIPLLKETLNSLAEANRELETKAALIEEEKSSIEQQMKLLKDELDPLITELENKNAIISVNETRISDLQESLKKQAENNGELMKDDEELECQADDTSREKSSVEAKIEEFQDELDQKNRLISDMETRLSELQEALKNQIETNKELINKNIVIEEENSSAKQEIELLKVELEPLVTQLEKQNAAISDSETRLTNLQESLNKQIEINCELKATCAMHDDDKSGNIALIKSQQAELQQLKSELENMNFVNEENKIQISELMEALDKKTECYKELEAKTADLKEKLELTQQQHDLLQEKIEQTNAELKERNYAILEAENQVSDLEEALNHQVQVNSELRAKNDDFEEENRSTKHELELIKDEVEQLLSKLELDSATMEDNKMQIQKLKEALNDQTEENDILALKNSELEEDKKAIQRRMELMQVELKEKSLFIEEKEADVSNLQETVKSQIKKCEELSIKCEELEEEKNDMNRNLELLQTRLEQLQSRLNDEDNISREYEDKISILAEELRGKNQVFSELETKYSESEMDRKDLLQKIEMLNDKLRDLKANHDDEKDVVIEKSETQIEELKKSLEKQIQAFSKLETKYSESETDRRNLLQKMEMLNDKLQELRASHDEKDVVIEKSETQIEELKKSVEKQIQVQNDLKIELESEQRKSEEEILSLQIELEQLKLALESDDAVTAEKETQIPEESSIEAEASPYRMTLGYTEHEAQTALDDKSMHWKTLYEDLLQAVKVKEDEIKLLKETNAQLESDVSKYKEDFEFKAGEIDILTSRSTESESALEAVLKENKDLQSSLELWKAKYQGFEKNYTAIKDTCTRLENANKEIDSKLKAENCAVFEELEDIRNSLQKLNALIKDTRLSHSQDRINKQVHVQASNDKGSLKEMNDIATVSESLPESKEVQKEFDYDPKFWKAKYEELEKLYEAIKGKCSSLEKSNAMLNQTIDEIEENLQETFQEKQNLQNQLKELQNKQEKSLCEKSAKQKGIELKLKAAKENSKKMLETVQSFSSIQMQRDKIKVLLKQFRLVYEEKENLLLNQRSIIDENSSLIERRNKKIDDLNRKVQEFGSFNVSRAHSQDHRETDRVNSVVKSIHEKKEKLLKNKSNMKINKCLKENIVLTPSEVLINQNESKLFLLENYVEKLETDKNSLVKELSTLRSKLERVNERQSDRNAEKDVVVCSLCNDKDKEIENLNSFVKSLQQQVTEMTLGEKESKTAQSYVDCLKEHLLAFQNSYNNHKPESTLPNRTPKEDATVSEELLSSLNSHLEKKVHLEEKILGFCFKEKIRGGLNKQSSSTTENTDALNEAPKSTRDTSGQVIDNVHSEKQSEKYLATNKEHSKSLLSSDLCTKCVLLSAENGYLKAKENSLQSFWSRALETLESFDQIWERNLLNEVSTNRSVCKDSSLRTNSDGHFKQDSKKHESLLTRFEEETKNFETVISKFTLINELVINSRKEQDALCKALQTPDDSAEETKDSCHSLALFINLVSKCLSNFNGRLKTVFSSVEKCFIEFEQAAFQPRGESRNMESGAAKVEELESKTEKTESKLKRMEEKLRLFAVNSRRFEKCYNDLQVEHTKLLDEVEKLRGNGNSGSDIANELKITRERLKAATEKLNEMESKLKETENKLQESDGRLKEAENELKETKNKLQESDDRLKKMEEKYEEGQKDIDRLYEELEETDNKFSKAKRDCSILKANYFSVLRKLEEFETNSEKGTKK